MAQKKESEEKENRTTRTKNKKISITKYWKKVWFIDFIRINICLFSIKSSGREARTMCYKWFYLFYFLNWKVRWRIREKIKIFGKKRKLTGVQEEMIFEICMFGEASRANATFEGPWTRMYVHMRFEIAWCWEGFRAKWTLVWFFLFLLNRRKKNSWIWNKALIWLAKNLWGIS